MIRRELGYITEQGLRDYQQDCFACCTINNLSLLIIADGNGGDGGFELAKTACKSLVSIISFDLAQGKQQTIETEEQLNEIGLNAINKTARQVRVVKDQNEWQDAGTTITLVVVTEKYVGTFWIGDSPAYVYDSEYLIQLNHPLHTLAESLIQEGQPRKEIAKQPSLSSILIRCAGHDNCTPDSKIIKIRKPFSIIAGSDGSLDYCPKSKIIQILKKKLNHSCDIDEVAFQIVSDALEAGSDDNCTLVAGHFYNSAKLVTRRLTRIYEPMFLKGE